MSAESALYAALSGASGLTALVGTRIYPDVIPEDADLPAVVYQRAGTAPVITISGSVLADDVRFVIMAWGKTRTSADAVADQVGQALAASGNPVVDRSTGYDPDVGLHGVTIDADWFFSY